MQIDVRSNMYDVLISLGEVRDKIISGATVRALNKVAATVRTEAAKDIRETYNIKSSAAKGQIDVRRATRSKLTATVVATGKSLPLLDYKGTRQNRTGVAVQIKVQGGRKTIQHAFIQTTRRGVPGVFRRVGKARYPIEFLMSVGVEKAFASKKIMDELHKVVDTRFPIVFRQELRFGELKTGPLKFQ